MRHSYSTLIHRLKVWPAITRLTCAIIIFIAALTTTHTQAAEDTLEQTAENVEPEIPAADPQQLQMQALAPKLNSSELSWLGNDDEPFITLYRPALNPSKMAVILLPDSLHKMVQHNILQELYTELPEKGWSTLHIAMPAIIEDPSMTAETNNDITPIPNTNAGTDTDTNSQEKDATSTNGGAQSEKKQKALEETALKRIGSAVDFLIEQNVQAFTLVAENLTAQWAIAAGIQQKDNTSGMVFWHVDALQLDEKQLKALSESRITILDIVDQNMRPETKTQRIRRFRMAGFEEDYRIITSPYGHAGIEHSQRRIRQWLETGFQKY